SIASKQADYRFASSTAEASSCNKTFSSQCRPVTFSSGKKGRNLSQSLRETTSASTLVFCLRHHHASLLEMSRRIQVLKASAIESHHRDTWLANTLHDQGSNPVGTAGSRWRSK
ncbi:unnamed protein product, partial [Protopolystoma xenopodis]